METTQEETAEVFEKSDGDLMQAMFDELAAAAEVVDGEPEGPV